MQIGSALWRIINYGPRPFLNYFIFRKQQFCTHSYTTEETVNFQTFFDYIVSLYDCEISQTEFDKLMMELNDELISASRAELLALKDGVIRLDKVSIRLKVLSLVLIAFRPNDFLETGTQHGISAYFAGEISNRLNFDTNVNSFDVHSSEIILKSEAVKYHTLQRPIRKNFRLSTNNFRDVVFFHDSDHSRENMLFEFNWAWHSLNCSALISDDVSGNDAFIDFCSTNNLFSFIVHEAGEPNVGIAIRNIPTSVVKS